LSDREGDQASITYGRNLSRIADALGGRDLEQVRNLFREYQAQLLPLYRAQSLENDLAQLPGAFSPPRGKLLLAMVCGQPVGCVGLRPFPLEGTCEMKHLYVRPTFRGGKVGKELVDRIVMEARGLGYSRLRLDTHPPSMQTAVAMYRSLGFKEVAPAPVEPVEGLVYMELPLVTNAEELDERKSL
jgi:N-acetylglutamate synthase-like GNAT family acetyltransferase